MANTVQEFKGLPGWTVHAAQVKEGVRIVDAHYTVDETRCQRCGTEGQLYRHGLKKLKLLDVPVEGRSTVIHATVQRYRCRHCAQAFQPDLAGVSTTFRMTERCERYVEEHYSKESAVAIAKRIGCVEGTVRRIGKRMVGLEAGS